jgi:hypothetical protein
MNVVTLTLPGPQVMLIEWMDIRTIIVILFISRLPPPLHINPLYRSHSTPLLIAISPTFIYSTLYAS